MAARWLGKNCIIEKSKSISPLTQFLIKAGGVYAAWQFLYNLFLLPDGSLDTFLSISGVNLAGSLLGFMGWEINVSGRIIKCIGHSGVEIQNGCNGLNLLGLYGGFIIAYPGLWKKRIIFLLIGLSILYFANIIRIAFFAVINANMPQYFQIAHDYSSYIFFYPIVLLFWYLWILISDERDILISG